MIVSCKCGCGETLEEKNSQDRIRSFISGHNGRKYDDPTQYKREWNHRNREARLKYKKNYHRKRKVALIAVAGGCCHLYGVKYNGTNACIFHFHHRIGAIKLFNIGNQVVNKSWARLLTELSKCDLLCANCHEIQHSGEF